MKGTNSELKLVMRFGEWSSPSKEIMNVFFEIAEKVDGRTKTWHPLERS